MMRYYVVIPWRATIALEAMLLVKQAVKLIDPFPKIGMELGLVREESVIIIIIIITMFSRRAMVTPDSH